MGLGREKMRKIYIDDILEKVDKDKPGPGRYESKQNFGKSGNCGQEYTFAGRLRRYNRALDDSKKLPGQGAYESTHLCGKALTNSGFTTSKNFSIGKESRFQVPTKKWMHASPASYKP